jgi:hypothetical protein
MIEKNMIEKYIFELDYFIYIFDDIIKTLNDISESYYLTNLNKRCNKKGLKYTHDDIIAIIDKFKTCYNDYDLYIFALMFMIIESHNFNINKIDYIDIEKYSNTYDIMDKYIDYKGFHVMIEKIFFHILVRCENFDKNFKKNKSIKIKDKLVNIFYNI